MKYFFTSINNAYIPKAIVLAESLKRVYGAQAHVTCMLSDDKRADIDYSAFDDVLTISELELPVPSVEGWIFKHTVVELCTAVKPWAFRKIFAKYDADAVVYMDPDTVLYSPLEEIYELLPAHPVIVTPHVSVPATDADDLLDGELNGCLRHGVFNLGFLALSRKAEGADFLEWWAKRCLDWCYDDPANGLFTDQRWIDLAPCFFPTMHVLRHPGYNMATWNLYHRELTRNGAGNLIVNDSVPLRFFHFSGFDIGTHEMMTEKHAPEDDLLTQITEWYTARQDQHGQERLGKRPGAYDFFSSGERIERKWRVLYRQHADVMAQFPHPYTQPNFEKWLRGSTFLSKLSVRFWNLLAAFANRVRKHPGLARWLKNRVPRQLQDRLRRRL
jgi:hypothetical protein